MPSVSRLVRKYPNRRLYDPTSSAYVTLADLRRMILAGERLCVKDARSDADVTHSVLLQVLLDGELAGRGVLDQDVLIRLICAQSQEPPVVSSEAEGALSITPVANTDAGGTEVQHEAQGGGSPEALVAPCSVAGI